MERAEEDPGRLLGRCRNGRRRVVLPYEGHSSSLMGGVGRRGEEGSLRYQDTGMDGLRLHTRRDRGVRGFDGSGDWMGLR